MGISISEMNISSSVTTLSYSAMIMETIMKRRFLFSGRPDSFTAVGYQTLAFIQVLENQKTVKKMDKSDKTGKSRETAQFKIH